MQLLIEGGLAHTPQGLVPADVLLADGRVAQVGPGLVAPGAQLVDARGCVVAPGLCDVHVHLRQPGFQAKETMATGTAAAAAGGFTTVCAMPNLHPVPDSPAHLAPQLAAVARHAVVEVLPYGALTQNEDGTRLAEIAALAGQVVGYSDDGRGVQSEDVMRKAMAAVATTGHFVAAHCEVEALLPQDDVCIQQGAPLAQKQGFAGVSNESEWREVERDIALARQTGCRLHICHASCAESFALVRKAKAQGLPVTCEVTPHNLLLSCRKLEDDGRFKMNPPLRSEADVAAARAALVDGTVDAIATDHAPHTAQEKAGGFAHSLNGVVGLETAFAVCYTHLVLGAGLLSCEQLLDLLCAGPRRLLGRDGGRLAAGNAANVTVLDITRRRPVQPQRFSTKGRSTPFAGWPLCGWPRLTVFRGQVVYQSGDGQA